MTTTEALQVFVKNILKNFTISMDFDFNVTINDLEINVDKKLKI